jgi:tetratricopeptide (TPR) repeat protein
LLWGIADFWRAQGKREAALDAYEKALAIGERLAAQFPGNTGWQRDLALSFERIGLVCSAEGERRAARDAYGKALAIYKELKAKGVAYPDMDLLLGQ